MEDETDWTEIDPKTYREIIAPKFLDHFNRDAEALSVHFFGLAKWLLATLLTVNTGSFLLLVQADRKEYFAAAGPYLITSLVLALFSALVAFLNSERNWHLARAKADPRLLASRRYVRITKPDTNTFLNRTYWASIILGSASVLALAAGGFAIWCTIAP